MASVYFTHWRDIKAWHSHRTSIEGEWNREEVSRISAIVTSPAAVLARRAVSTVVVAINIGNDRIGS